nr:Rieske (2Fe-2S) protein [Paraburkholderia phenazinium]
MEALYAEDANPVVSLMAEEAIRALGIAAALAQIGMPEEGLDEAADLAQVLMCAHHSALFRFEDGHCIEGPCAGANLDAIQVAVDNAARIILKQ